MNQTIAVEGKGGASIGQRLGLGFFAMLALVVFVAVLGSWRLLSLTSVTERILGVDTHTERVVREWAAETRANAVRALVLTRSDDADMRALLTPQLEAASKRISVLQKQTEDLLQTEDAKAIFKDVGTARKSYIDVRNMALALKKAGKFKEAQELVDSKMVPAIDAYMASIQTLVDYYVGNVKASAAEAAANALSGRIALVSTALVGVLLGIALAWRITISITVPLRQATGIAEKVAAGDLASRIEVTSTDETGRLLQALKNMNENLVSIVGEVRSGTEAIGSGTKQIASGNADLSQRTEEQASSLEETASSMEELTSTVHQNAENAKQANQLAIGASAVAVKGGHVVSEVVGTMSSINESSKKIVDIISVIDGIAFQTNILALNAAVEAARAGEQGRGFAVVATEVRTLAQRSAAAAKEIKALIGDSVDKVSAGTKLVDEAGKTMEEIVSSVKRVTDIMSEITAASQEQSAGIEQVNQAITQMDEVTQQNAALVEEAAAAAESLEEQAQNLTRAVAVFNIGGAMAGHSTVSDGSTELGSAQGERNRPINVARLPLRVVTG